MKKSTTSFLCLLVVLLAVAPAGAQQFDWVRTEPVNVTFNSNRTRYPTAADPAGNVAVAGYETNRTAIGNDFVLGDVALSSYSPTGALRFRRSLTGHNAAVTHLRYTLTGSLLMLGVFQDSVRLGPGAVLRRSVAGQSPLPFLASYDAAGVPQWYIVLPQALGLAIRQCHDLSTDATGQVYLAVTYDNDDNAVLRYSPLVPGPAVEVLRQTRAGDVSSLSRAANGDLYVVGSCPDPRATFGGVAAVTPYDYTLYVARYTASGRLRWVRFTQDITCPQPQVVADDHGGVYVSAAVLSGGMQVGPFRTTGTSLGENYLLARLDTAGTWQWLRQSPASSGTGVGTASVAQTTSLVVDAQGNAALALTYRGSIAWPTGTTTSAGTINSSTDALVLSYDPAGALRWVRAGGGPQLEYAHGLAAAPGGTFVLTGYSASGLLTFGAAQAGPAVAAPAFFVAHLAAAAPTAVRAGQVAGSWELAPNPARPDTRLRFGAGAALPPTVELRNALGQMVRRLPVAGLETAVSTVGLAPGLYWLQATAGNVRYQARLVVE